MRFWKQIVNYLSVGKDYFKITNFVIFQSVWMMSVVGQGAWVAVTISLLAVHFVLSPSKVSDGKLMIAVATIGVLFDYLLMTAGFFIFEHHIFPIWLGILWCAFALTLNHSFAWLPRLPIVIQSALGAFGGTASYIGGHYLGAVEFGFSLLATAALLALLWALATPFYGFLQRVSIRNVSYSP